MGNATWKNDCKYFRKWIIDSYGFIPCSFYLWIVYSPIEQYRFVELRKPVFVEEEFCNEIF